jgi:hypothetical protein
MNTRRGMVDFKPDTAAAAARVADRQPAIRHTRTPSPPQRLARAGVWVTLGSAAMALIAALVSGWLLLINGSFVLVFLHTVSQDGPEWFRRKGTMQFALFVLPLLMLVAQWMIWDLLRGLFSRRDGET